MTGLAEWFLGGFLVFLYAHGRFRSPMTNIGSTTLFRFHLAAWLYYAATVLLFCFLSVMLSSTPEILGALQFNGGADLEKLKALSSPIAAALLMTALLPNVPWLSKADTWILQVFQELGHIPLEVRLWRDRLTTCELRIPEDAKRAVRKKVAEDSRLISIKEEDLRFEDDESPQFRFTRLIYLMSVVEGFSVARGKYPRVLEQFQDEYVEVRQRFEQAILTATRSFGAMAQATAAATPVVIELKQSLREQCEQTYRQMCQLLARGILMSEPTQRDRSKKLEALGFESFEETIAKLDVNQILTVVSVVFLILFASIALIEGPGESTRGLYIATMVAVIYGAAVVCALAPKLAWRYADVAELGSRPVWSYLLSGAMGVGSAIVVSVMFKSFLLEGGFLAAVRDVRFSWPYYLLTFCVTVTLAVFCDNWGGRSTREPRWGRYAEGFGLAVLLAVTFLLARAMFEEMPGLDPERIPNIRITAVMFLIGFFLGAFVPSWYRRMRTPPR